ADEDHAFTALMLLPPSETELAQAMTPVDPDGIHDARDRLILTVAEAHHSALDTLYRRLATTGAFSPDAKSAGRRALRNAALRFLTARVDEAAGALAQAHFDAASSMTDLVPGLANLLRMGGARAETALATFHDRFKTDPLVLDKWMSLQA